MNELDALRSEVSRLMVEGNNRNLTDDQRIEILARANALWSRLSAAMREATGMAEHEQSALETGP